MKLTKPPIGDSALCFALRIIAIFLFLLLIWPDTSAPAPGSPAALEKNSGQRHLR